MEKFWISKKRNSFSLTELILSIFLIGLVLPSVGVAGHQFLKEWKFKSDVEHLRLQLQMGHDFSLHCEIPVAITLRETKRGLFCKLEFENKLLERKLPTERFYPHIKHMMFSNANTKYNQRKIHYLCSFSGGLDKPSTLILKDASKKKQLSMEIYGYPHVLEIKKK